MTNYLDIQIIILIFVLNQSKITNMDLTEKIADIIEVRKVSRSAIYNQLGVSPKTLKRRMKEHKFEPHHEKLFNMIWGRLFND